MASRDSVRVPEKGHTTTNNALKIPLSTILTSFAATKQKTDDIIIDQGFAGYYEQVHPRQAQLCIALTCETFQKLGCHLQSAKPEQRLRAIRSVAAMQKELASSYQLLEQAGIIRIDDDQIIRTDIAIPNKSGNEILEELLIEFPSYEAVNSLIFHAGINHADIFTGRSDGVQAIFGSPRGRELIEAVHGDSHTIKASHRMMEDFMARFLKTLPHDKGTIQIMELGAGTGGTTKWLVPLLARLKVPVEYTFTDISNGFLIQAKRKFQKYPFMRYKIHDIDAPPQPELISTQHLIVAVNVMHATPSLATSLRNTRQLLRPDGFLTLLEMGNKLSWTDMVFGLFEGWWMFNDGREHACINEDDWAKAFHSAGYSNVDWTQGTLPETGVQRVFIATP